MDTAFTTQFEKRSFVPESAELKAHEKRAIVSHFLHNDQVFVHLCEYLFQEPHKNLQNAKREVISDISYTENEK